MALLLFTGAASREHLDVRMLDEVHLGKSPQETFPEGRGSLKESTS